MATVAKAQHDLKINTGFKVFLKKRYLKGNRSFTRNFLGPLVAKHSQTFDSNHMSQLQ